MNDNHKNTNKKLLRNSKKCINFAAEFINTCNLYEES